MGITVVDTSIASVPLDQIAFDTFDGSFVRLADATDELILFLQDRIPPLDNPEYVGADEVDYLHPNDLLLGYSPGEEHYAYPFRILNFHEFVNDELDSIPVLISYCPLCRSGIVFNRRLDGQTLSFGNTSALYENNAVAYDRETGSYWFQVAGEAIVGPLTGKRLKPLPSVTTTWEEWKSLHPDTLVLSTNTGYNRPYSRDRFAGFENRVNRGRFFFPISEAALDPRLPLGSHVLVVMVQSGVKAYPLDDLGDAAVNDVIGGEMVMILSKASGPSGAAYLSELRGRSLTFRLQEGRYIDEETGSTWNLAGRAVAGELEGENLKPVPTLFAFWFSAVVTHPGIELYSP